MPPLFYHFIAGGCFIKSVGTGNNDDGQLQSSLFRKKTGSHFFGSVLNTVKKFSCHNLPISSWAGVIFAGRKGCKNKENVI